MSKRAYVLSVMIENSLFCFSFMQENSIFASSFREYVYKSNNSTSIVVSLSMADPACECVGRGEGLYCRD